MTDAGASYLRYTPRERTSVAVSTVLGFGLDFYNILIVSFLMGAIQRSLGISLTQAGIITSVTLAGSVVGGIFFGWIGDRIGRKISLLLTLGLFSVGAILSAFSWDFLSLLIFRAIAGVGLGGEWGAGMVLFNEVWDRNRRGLGSSIVQAATSVGIAAAVVVALWALGSFSDYWGWRIALLTGGSPILLMIYVRLWMPESRLWQEYERLRKAGDLPLEKATEGSPLVEIFRGASLRYTILGFLMVMGYMFSFYSVTVFMPGLMVKLGATPEAIRSTTLLWAAVLGGAMLAVGWYSDHLGRKLGVIIPALISVVGFVGIYASGAGKYPGSILVWPVFWWYVLWAAGQTSAAMFGPWFSELYPVELRATAVSTIYMVGRGAGSMAPYVVPVAAASFGGNILEGMMIGIAAAVLCLVAALALPETAGRSFAVVESKERAEPV